MTRKEMKKQAKAQLSGSWGIAIGAWLLMEILISAASGFTFGISSLFTGVLTFGLTGIYMSIVRTGDAKLETLFSGFSNFVNSFLAGLLETIYIFLWTWLFIIPGIVKSYSYAMTFYILCDNPEMSGNDAITASRKMMKGNKWRLFVLDLSFIGWHLLAILTLGLLHLYITPYMQATRAQFYEDLKAKNAPPAEEGFDNADGGNDNGGDNGNGDGGTYIPAPASEAQPETDSIVTEL